jgi:voltage-gated potassium channel
VFQGLAVFVLTCIVGTIGYLLAGWSLSDAFYMVIITIFGVGYGEVRPILSPGMRSMTILLIVFGYAAAIYTVGGFVQMLMEGEINRALNRRRMTRGIEELTGHTILCGYGRAGRILAQGLLEAKTPFVVVDQDDAKLNEAEQMGCLIVEGNATEDEALLRAGVERASVLATVLPDDSANVFITLTARELNPLLKIIARAENPASEKKLLRSGATEVVLPAVIGGKKMAQLITCPSTEQFLAKEQGHDQLQHELNQIGLKLDELPIAPDSTLDGQQVGGIDLRGGNRSFLIVAVRHRDGTVVVDPKADCPLAAGDAVIVLGHGNELPVLKRAYTEKREITYRGAKIKV